MAIGSRSGDTVSRAGTEIGAHAYRFDSADIEQIPALIAKVEADLGPIDIFIANTGGPPTHQDQLHFDQRTWEMAHRTLMLSPLAIIDQVMPGMRARQWGRGVAIGSYTVLEPLGYLQASNAHRPGLVTVFKAMSRVVAGDGVTLNHVHPGHIATARMMGIVVGGNGGRVEYPTGRMGEPDEVAAAVVFLTSRPASCITGTSLLVDGGLSRALS